MPRKPCEAIDGRLTPPMTSNFFPSGVLNGETSYANPMWAWQGGSGEYKNIFGAHEYWYSFGVDNTQNYFEGIPWPSIPFGALLTDPIFVQNTYFPPANGFPSWNQNMLFNPFRGSALPPPPPQLIASVGGPTQISGCEINQWQAVVTSGTPPYTYSWSGDVSGTGQYVEGSSQTDMLIALDVWDATGQHAAPALYVHVSGGFC